MDELKKLCEIIEQLNEVVRRLEAKEQQEKDSKAAEAVSVQSPFYRCCVKLDTGCLNSPYTCLYVFPGTSVYHFLELACPEGLLHPLSVKMDGVCVSLDSVITRDCVIRYQELLHE